MKLEDHVPDFEGVPVIRFGREAAVASGAVLDLGGKLAAGVESGSVSVTGAQLWDL